MSRLPRKDEPGTWHHVINRAIGKRPLFEDRADIRYFLSRLAREVQRGRIEIHAWCVLTTHFHLLVRSPVGELSEAMRRSQNEYVRYFNRRRKRDGTLVRGRFFSKPVETLSYRRTLVKYIDANPVKAKMGKKPWDYPWCSAASYMRGKGPVWMARSWVEDDVRARCPTESEFPLAYSRVFGRGLKEGQWQLVESRIAIPRVRRDYLDDLIGAAPPQVRAWMCRKTALADGHELGAPVCDATSITRAIGQSRKAKWRIRLGARNVDGWDVLETGLLREMAGLTWDQLARVTHKSSSSCQRRLLLHRELLQKDREYSERAGEAGAAALRTCHG